MSWKVVDKGFFFSLLVIICVTNSCTSNTNEISKYRETLSKLGIEKSMQDSLLLLFVRTNECKPCLDELKFWNLVHEENKLDVVLIVNERFPLNFNKYIESKNLQLIAYQDSSNLFGKSNLIPYYPYKVLLSDNQVSLKEEMGINRKPF